MCVGDEGTWEFDRNGVSPAFDEEKWWHAETDSGSDTEADDAAARMIVTANGTFAYNTDSNGIERAKRPAARAARLLHAARAHTDTSRWWSMRWPTDAMSVLGRACGLLNLVAPTNCCACSETPRALRRLLAQALAAQPGQKA